jgi:hypothetical protein
MKWMGLVVCRGERINAYNILVKKYVGKIPSGRPGHKWEGNMKMDTSVNCFCKPFCRISRNLLTTSNALVHVVSLVMVRSLLKFSDTDSRTFDT